MQITVRYTGHSNIRGDPPTYVAIGANDGIASPSVMRKALKTEMIMF